MGARGAADGSIAVVTSYNVTSSKSEEDERQPLVGFVQVWLDECWILFGDFESRDARRLEILETRAVAHGVLQLFQVDLRRDLHAGGLKHAIADPRILGLRESLLVECVDLVAFRLDEQVAEIAERTNQVASRGLRRTAASAFQVLLLRFDLVEPLAKGRANTVLYLYKPIDLRFGQFAACRSGIR